MNKYQRLVITVAVIDLIVILLFPPFVERTLAKHALPSFDGFYFLISEFGRRPIDTALLSLETLWLATNTLSAWLLLGPATRETNRESRHSVGIAVFAFVNLTIICLFPPFEQYNSLLRTTAPGFDSFYFVLGDRSARPIFQPLLQLEIFFVLINALALYLLFNAVQRGEIAELERQAAEAEASRRKLQPDRAEGSKQRLATLGRKEDRRHQADPGYHGSERRSGHDRRHPN